MSKTQTDRSRHIKSTQIAELRVNGLRAVTKTDFKTNIVKNSTFL